MAFVTLVSLTATLVFLMKPAEAGSTLLTNDQLIRGKYQYGSIDTGQGSIKLQSGATGTWSGSDGMREPPVMSYGTNRASVSVNNSVYLITAYGSSNNYWLRYDLTFKEWEYLTLPPGEIGSAGVTLTTDGTSYIYLTPGGNTPFLYRYNISSDTWDRLADLSITIGTGAWFTYTNYNNQPSLYGFRGNGSSTFWRYDIASNTWQSELNFPASGALDYGFSAAWMGNNTIYAITNYPTNQLARYNMGTNQWFLTRESGGGNLAVPASCYNVNHLMKVNSTTLIDLVENTGCNTTNFYQFDIPNNKWSNLASTPWQNWVDYDPAITLNATATQVYAVGTGYYMTDLYNYTIATDSWNLPFNLHAHAYQAEFKGQLVYDGNNTAYYVSGAYWGTLDKLYKVDLTTGLVTFLSNTSVTGWTGVYALDPTTTPPNQPTLYFTQWPGSSGFRKFNLITNGWTDATQGVAQLPATAQYSSKLIDGGDGYLYAPLGGGTAFYRYNLTTNTWSALASAPASMNNEGGIAKIGSFIYVLPGAGSANFLKYNMGTNTWTSLDQVPAGYVNYGGLLVGDNTRYLYLVPSDRTDASNRMFIRYDTTNGQWLRMADLPDGVNLKPDGFYNSLTSKLYLTPDSSSGKLWWWQAGTTTFQTSGTWYSDVLDFPNLSSWNGVSSTISGTGTATIYSRSSSDKHIWSDWQVVTGNTTIQSPVQRYLQLRVDLSSDGTTTPAVSNLTVNYLQDTTNPNLPSQFTAHDQLGSSTVLASGTNYKYEHPSFTWNNATDPTPGSGVAGYYVYFGTDSNADPAVAGSYQTSTTYTVSTAMTSAESYYVRLRTKDNAGNLSAATTFFTYQYFYISPPAALIWTDQSDFSAVGTEDVNTDLTTEPGSVLLKKQNQGAWTTGISVPSPATTIVAGTMVGDYLYAIRGNSTNSFYRYDTKNQVWSTLQTLPVTATTGSSLATDGGRYLYATVGGNTNTFLQYDTLTNQWTTMNTIPVSIRAGSSLTYAGNGHIFVFASDTTELYQYTISSNTWQNISTLPMQSYSSRDGAGSYWDGGNYLYFFAGAVNSYSGWYAGAGLQRYSIDSGTWTRMTAPPFSPNFTENNLVGDGHGGLYIFGQDGILNQAKKLSFRYDIASDTWKELSGTYTDMAYGTVVSDNDRYLYIFPSLGNDSQMVVYDTNTQQYVPGGFQAGTAERARWDLDSNWYWSSGNASSIAYDGTDHLYLLGSDASNFSRLAEYSISKATTTFLPSPPYIGQGGALTYSNGYLYYVLGSNTTLFYRFNFVSRLWERMADAPATMYLAGSSSLIAANDGTLYAARGNSATSFYKYTPNGTTGSWSTLANIPGSFNLGSMVYDPTTSYIYLLRGNGTSNFYRYSLGANSWTTLATLPNSTSYGSTMVLDSGKIYATQGNATSNSFVYTIGSNTWTTGTTTPTAFRSGASIVKIDSTRAFAIAGSSTYGLYQFLLPQANQGYQGMATHISQPISINGLYDYAGITAQEELPANTAIDWYTRTSADGITWSNWVLTTDTKNFTGQVSTRIVSPPQKFIQIKARLTSSDNLYTPKLYSYTLQYYFDVDPPSNPDGNYVKLYTNTTKSTEIDTTVSNSWHNNAQPFIDWPDPGEVGGASDGSLGSQIKGYWIYAGTDPTAVPRTAGTFVTTSEYQPTLTTAGTYYVRLQSQDYTGNISDDNAILAPFSYNFDNVPPDNPALITVTPSGYTGTNKFTFEWPAAFDANSNIKDYCYKTGSATGPYATEQCQTSRTLTDLAAAYQQGANVLYVRTRDNASNYSAGYAQVTYYYSTDPPTAPTNLKSLPPSSSQNLFSFTWDKPASFSGDGNQLTYCYSINALPAASNSICTSDTFVAPFAAATRSGTNVFYVVAKDETNAVLWSNYASVSFQSNVVAPGLLPARPVVNDTSDRNNNRFSLTVTWQAPAEVGNGIASYKIERSDNSGPYATIGSSTSTAFTDQQITQGTTYVYRVSAVDSLGTAGGTVESLPAQAKGRYTTPPDIIVQPSVQAGSDQAVVSWNISRAAEAAIYWGRSKDNLDKSLSTASLGTSQSFTLTGLLPETDYYYRIVQYDEDRTYDISSVLSSIYTFRTSEAPRILNVTTSDLGLSSVVLSWSSTVPVKARVIYGTTSGYGLATTPSDGFSSSYVVRLDGLQNGTTYRYRIDASTSTDTSVQSDEYQLTTLPYPKVTNLRFQPTTDGANQQLVVTWTTNVATDSVVNYQSSGQAKSVSDSTLSTSHQITLNDLASSAQYIVTAGGRDQYGNLAISDENRIVSSVDTKPPEMKNLRVDVSTTGSWGSNKAVAVVTWTTDEPASSFLSYNTGGSSDLNQKTTLNADLSLTHTVVLPNLELGRVYKLQAHSSDITGNEGKSAEILVATPQQQRSFLDVLTGLFGGLSSKLHL